MHLGEKRNTFFFGWWIVIAGFFISLYTCGVIFFGFTAAFEPIAIEFGWSYVEVSIAASLRGLELGLLAPLMGVLVDRWGPRRLMLGGAFVIGLGMLLLSRINTLGMYYTAFVIIAIGMSMVGSTVLMASVVNWFQRRAATAIGIVVSGVAAGGLLIPVVTMVIDAYQWRTAMVIFGLGMCLILMPLSLLFRHRPEKYGYLIDGAAINISVTDQSNYRVPVVEEAISIKRVLTSRTFWHIAPAFICYALVVSAVVTHIMPYFSSLGVARVTSSFIASALPVTSIIGRFGAGWFADRFGRRLIAVLSFVLTSLGLLSFSYISDSQKWLIVLFVIFFATGWGSAVPMRGALVLEYFGRNRFGTIQGFVDGISLMGALVGAPLAGWVFDSFGSYQGIWLVYAVVAIAGAVPIMTIPPFTAKPKNK